MTFCIEAKLDDISCSYKIAELLAALDHHRHDYFMNMWVKENIKQDHEYVISDVEFSSIFPDVRWGPLGKRTPDYVTVNGRDVTIYEFAVTTDIKMAKLGKTDVGSDVKYTQERGVLEAHDYKVKIVVVILDLRAKVVDYNVKREDAKTFQDMIVSYSDIYRVINQYVWTYFSEERALADMIEMRFGNKVLTIFENERRNEPQMESESRSDSGWSEESSSEVREMFLPDGRYNVPLEKGTLRQIFDFKTTREKLKKIISSKKDAIKEQLDLLAEHESYTITLDNDINQFIFVENNMGIQMKYLRKAIMEDDYNILINYVTQVKKDTIKRLDADIDDLNVMLSNKTVVTDEDIKGQLQESDYINLDFHDYSEVIDYEGYEYKYKNLSELNKSKFMYYNTDELIALHNTMLQRTRKIIKGTLKVKSLADYPINEGVIGDALKVFKTKYDENNSNVVVKWKNPFKVPLVADYRRCKENVINHELFGLAYQGSAPFKSRREARRMKSDITDKDLLNLKKEMRSEVLGYKMKKRELINNKSIGVVEKDRRISMIEKMSKDSPDIDTKKYFELKSRYDALAKSKGRIMNKDVILIKIGNQDMKTIKGYKKKENGLYGIGKTATDYDKLHEEIIQQLLNLPEQFEVEEGESFDPNENNFIMFDYSVGKDNKISNELKKEAIKKAKAFDDEFMSTCLAKSLSFIWNFTQSLIYYSGIPLEGGMMAYDNLRTHDTILLVAGGKSQMKIKDKQTRFYSVTHPVYDLEIYNSVPTNTKNDVKSWYRFENEGKIYIRSPFMQMNERMVTFCVSLPHKIYLILLRDYVELGDNLMISLKKRLFCIMLALNSRRQTETMCHNTRYLLNNLSGTHSFYQELLPSFNGHNIDHIQEWIRVSIMKNLLDVYRSIQSDEPISFIIGSQKFMPEEMAELMYQSYAMCKAPVSRLMEQMTNLKGIIEINTCFLREVGEQSWEGIKDETDVGFDVGASMTSDFEFSSPFCMLVGKFMSDLLVSKGSKSVVYKKFSKILKTPMSSMAKNTGLRSEDENPYGKKGTEVFFDYYEKVHKDALKTLDELWVEGNGEIDRIIKRCTEKLDMKYSDIDWDETFNCMLDAVDKEQRGGAREIYAMNLKLKIRQQPLELFFQALCEEAINELISVPSNMRLQMIHTKIFEKMENERRSKIFLTLDCTKWAPKSNFIKYTYFIAGMADLLPGAFLYMWYRFVQSYMRKKVTFKKSVIDAFKNNEKFIEHERDLKAKGFEILDNDYSYGWVMPYSFMMGIMNYLSSLLHAGVQLYFKSVINTITREPGFENYNMDSVMLCHSDDSGGYMVAKNDEVVLRMYSAYEHMQRLCNHLISKKKSVISKNMFELLSIFYYNKRLLPLTIKNLYSFSADITGDGYFKDAISVYSKVTELISNSGSFELSYVLMKVYNSLVRYIHGVPINTNSSNMPIEMGGVPDAHPLMIMSVSTNSDVIRLVKYCGMDKAYNALMSDDDLNQDGFNMPAPHYTPRLSSLQKESLTDNSFINHFERQWPVTICDFKNTFWDYVKHRALKKKTDYYSSLQNETKLQRLYRTIYCKNKPAYGYKGLNFSLKSWMETCLYSLIREGLIQDLDLHEVGLEELSLEFLNFETNHNPIKSILEVTDAARRLDSLLDVNRELKTTPNQIAAKPTHINIQLSDFIRVANNAYMSAIVNLTGSEMKFFLPRNREVDSAIRYVNDLSGGSKNEKTLMTLCKSYLEKNEKTFHIFSNVGSGRNRIRDIADMCYWLQSNQYKGRTLSFLVDQDMSQHVTMPDLQQKITYLANLLGEVDSNFRWTEGFKRVRLMLPGNPTIEEWSRYKVELSRDSFPDFNIAELAYRSWSPINYKPPHWFWLIRQKFAVGKYWGAGTLFVYYTPDAYGQFIVNNEECLEGRIHADAITVDRLMKFTEIAMREMGIRKFTKIDLVGASHREAHIKLDRGFNGVYEYVMAEQAQTVPTYVSNIRVFNELNDMSTDIKWGADIDSCSNDSGKIYFQLNFAIENFEWKRTVLTTTLSEEMLEVLNSQFDPKSHTAFGFVRSQKDVKDKGILWIDKHYNYVRAQQIEAAKNLGNRPNINFLSKPGSMISMLQHLKNNGMAMGDLETIDKRWTYARKQWDNSQIGLSNDILAECNDKLFSVSEKYKIREKMKQIESVMKVKGTSDDLRKTLVQYGINVSAVSLNELDDGRMNRIFSAEYKETPAQNLIAKHLVPMIFNFLDMINLEDLDSDFDPKFSNVYNRVMKPINRANIIGLRDMLWHNLTWGKRFSESSDTVLGELAGLICSRPSIFAQWRSLTQLDSSFHLIKCIKWDRPVETWWIFRCCWHLLMKEHLSSFKPEMQTTRFNIASLPNQMIIQTTTAWLPQWQYNDVLNYNILIELHGTQTRTILDPDDEEEEEEIEVMYYHCTFKAPSVVDSIPDMPARDYKKFNTLPNKKKMSLPVESVMKQLTSINYLHVYLDSKQAVDVAKKKGKKTMIDKIDKKTEGIVAKNYTTAKTIFKSYIKSEHRANELCRLPTSLFEGCNNPEEYFDDDDFPEDEEGKVWPKKREVLEQDEKGDYILRIRAGLEIYSEKMCTEHEENDITMTVTLGVLMKNCRCYTIDNPSIKGYKGQLIVNVYNRTKFRIEMPPWWNEIHHTGWVNNNVMQDGEMKGAIAGLYKDISRPETVIMSKKFKVESQLESIAVSETIDCDKQQVMKMAKMKKHKKMFIKMQSDDEELIYGSHEKLARKKDHHLLTGNNINIKMGYEGYGLNDRLKVYDEVFQEASEKIKAWSDEEWMPSIKMRQASKRGEYKNEDHFFRLKVERSIRRRKTQIDKKLKDKLLEKTIKPKNWNKKEVRIGRGLVMDDTLYKANIYVEDLDPKSKFLDDKEVSTFTNQFMSSLQGAIESLVKIGWSRASATAIMESETDIYKSWKNAYETNKGFDFGEWTEVIRKLLKEKGSNFMDVLNDKRAVDSMFKNFTQNEARRVFLLPEYFGQLNRSNVPGRSFKPFITDSQFRRDLCSIQWDLPDRLSSGNVFISKKMFGKMRFTITDWWAKSDKNTKNRFLNPNLLVKESHRLLLLIICNSCQIVIDGDLQLEHAICNYIDLINEENLEDNWDRMVEDWVENGTREAGLIGDGMIVQDVMIAARGYRVDDDGREVRL